MKGSHLIHVSAFQIFFLSFPIQLNCPVNQFTQCFYVLLSCFSRVRLCATPQMAAHQALPSLGFSGKNAGVGCHFLLQYMKVKSESKVAQSCPTLSDPMYCSLPGSSIHGIFQARVLEWGTIAFSVYVLGLSILDLQQTHENQKQRDFNLKEVYETPL